MSFSDKLAKKQFSKFNAGDLLFYYQYKADRKHIRCIITNKIAMKSVFSKLKKEFSQEEICTMIDYLFDSGQTFIEMPKATPFILYSGYTQRIWAEAMEWHKKPKREWDNTENAQDITSWGE